MSILSIPIDETGESTRIVRSGVFYLVVFLGGFAVWSTLAPISGAVVAGGSVKIDANRKTVQHLEGGVIREILVKEGQEVVKGQPLLTVEDAEVRSNLTILRDQFNAQTAKVARLEAERTLAKSISFPRELTRSADPKVREWLRDEQALFQIKTKSLDDELTILRNQIGEAGREQQEIDKQIAAAQEGIRLKEQRVAAIQALSEKHYIDQNQLLQIKEELSAKVEALAQMRAQSAATRQRAGELELRILTARNLFIKTAEDELKLAIQAASEAREKIAPAELALGRFRVLAPIAGQVIDLKVSTIGGVIRPGDPLMDVVPHNQELIVEVKVQTKDIPNVHVGQKADIQLSAYSKKSIPHVGGEVVYVSGDALADSNPSNPPHYLTHIRVSESELARLPEVTLSPGMPVEAYIQTKPRTFLEMLIKPLNDSLARGLRQES